MARNKYGGVNDMPSGWAKENKKVYILWLDMLRRCYDKDQQSRSKGKSYADCEVCDRWFYLSNFYEDIQRLPGYSEWERNGKMSIDKDLFSMGAKEYSPKTCCFVPSSVNIAEKNRRNPTIQKAIEANKTQYVLSKGEERLVFQSEKEACEKLGVEKCSISSCYRRGYKCKGYSIERESARMDLEHAQKGGDEE